jgi:hypothetical protein
MSIQDFLRRRGCLATLLAAVSACAGAPADPREPPGPKYEARAWLHANQNPSPLASNRFGPKTAAVAFVDSLYQVGADTVYVVGVEEDSSWIRAEGGPYADALWVRLPTASTQRARLFAIGAREARRGGFDPYVDHGQRYTFFWWD